MTGDTETEGRGEGEGENEKRSRKGKERVKGRRRREKEKDGQLVSWQGREKGLGFILFWVWTFRLGVTIVLLGLFSGRYFSMSAAHSLRP